MYYSTYLYLSIVFIYIIWYYFFSDKPKNRGKKSKVQLNREELMYLALIRKVDVTEAKVKLKLAEFAERRTLKELEEATNAVKKETDEEFDEMVSKVSDKFRRIKEKFIGKKKKKKDKDKDKKNDKAKEENNDDK